MQLDNDLLTAWLKGPPTDEPTWRARIEEIQGLRDEVRELAELEGCKEDVARLEKENDELADEVANLETLNDQLEDELRQLKGVVDAA